VSQGVASLFVYANTGGQMKTSAQRFSAKEAKDIAARWSKLPVAAKNDQPQNIKS